MLPTQSTPFWSQEKPLALDIKMCVLWINLRNNSWNPFFESSFNLGNIIFVNISSQATTSDKMQRK